MLSRLAARIGITAIPLYLLAGLAVGKGGLIDLEVTEGFISLAAEIGVLLLLFSLGLEYSDSELRSGLRTGLAAGVVDMALNAVPGVIVGLLLGWTPTRRGAVGRRHVDHLVGCRVEGAVRSRPPRQPRDTGGPEPARDRGPRDGGVPAGRRSPDRRREHRGHR